MRTDIRVRPSLGALAAALLALSAPLAHAGNESGHGGAGVFDQGEYKTFYSEGLYVEPQPTYAPPFEVPGLDRLIASLHKLTIITPEARTRWVGAAIQSPNHAYYKVVPNSLTPEIKARLLAVFERVTHVPTANLRLFALTDTAQKETFLLPEFFQLSTEDQAAILFHETYWLAHPKATYSEVVGAEMAFQATITQPDDPLPAMDLVSRIGNHSEVVAYAARTDVDSGALRGMIRPDSSVTLEDLFGADYLACRGSYPYGYWEDHCIELLVAQFSKLSAAYPKSLFLRIFMEDVRNPQASGSSHIEWILAPQPDNHLHGTSESICC